MRINDIRTLYAYNTWANARILDAAARVPAEQFATAALGACNLRDTLLHILVAESIWLLRWQGIVPESVEFPDDFPTLDALRARWREEERQLTAFLDTLGDADLDSTLTYRRSDGEIATGTLWHLLLHVVNHGTQHRAELALLLTALGHSPGDVDVTIFLRELQGNQKT
jgi:uncharacterized damage-inducible protein DinB